MSAFTASIARPIATSVVSGAVAPKTRTPTAARGKSVYEGQMSAGSGRTGVTFPSLGGTAVARLSAVRGRASAKVWLGQKRTGGLTHVFSRIANRISEIAGSHWSFVSALLIIVLWAGTGPLFGFSDSWQLWINSATTLVTFLMVFIIQNTQNRDAKAMQLKLDELLRAVPGARKAFMDVEDEDLAEIVREKEIVDRADPYPPTDKAGNGRPKRRAGSR
jgi:low affinity Fe/Cu permease